MSLHIRPFEPRDQDAVRRLVLAGLGEHFGWIDETRNPDLDDIETNYLKREHTFIVAEIDGKLVGTGALLTESQNTGRIVRISVSQARRRNGIGRALVTRLLSIARQKTLNRFAWQPHPAGTMRLNFTDAVDLLNTRGTIKIFSL
jgi:ribosomal protein S18 acetylase RimI-like enzyme